MFDTGNRKEHALFTIVAPKLIFVCNKVIDQRF